MGARAFAAGRGKGACGASGNEDCEARETGPWQDRGWSPKALGGTASSRWACWPCPPSFSAPGRGKRVIAQLLFDHNSDYVSSGSVCQALGWRSPILWATHLLVKQLCPSVGKCNKW